MTNGNIMQNRCFWSGHLYNYSSVGDYVNECEKNLYAMIFFVILNVAYDFT